MTSAQISFTIPNRELKERAYRKAKSEGITMKGLFISFLEEYTSGKYKMGLIPQDQVSWDDTTKTAENEKHYKEAMEDLKNGVNWVSQEEIFAKYL